MLRSSTPHLHRRGVDLRAWGSLNEGTIEMIRVHRATPAPAPEGEPDDLAMRFVEIGLAILAIAAAGVLALIR
jgi:hypothetical protein